MANEVPLVTEPRVSERFNAQDAEIVFQSADDVKFYIHRQNLVACTEGFSPPDPATFDDVVHLSESSSTLELLFRFIYPEPQPDLEEIDFSVLIMLAEAAEKYQVYSAVNICSIHLTKRLPEQSEEILVHALKHSNRKIVARAAPLLLGRSLEDVLLKVPQPYQILWIRYHAQWSRVWAHSISCAPNAQELARDVCRQCGKLRHEYVIEAMSKLSTSIDMLRALDSVFSSSTMCSSCCGELSVMKSWRKSLEAEIKRIPSTNDLFFPGDDPSKGKKTEPDSPEVVHADGETPTRRISLGSGADIIFQSADGVLFELHQQNIKACAANLLPPEYDSLAPIQIPHASSTLRLLFRFLYPFPHPDLELTDFLTLELLSAAAEQYKIYPAIRVIDIRLSDALPLNLVQHTSTVMKHALRTNNRKLMDTSAPLLIEKPISDTAKLMASDVIIHWLDYYERWNEIAHRALMPSSNRSVTLRSVKSPSSSTQYRACDGCRHSSDDLTINVLSKLGRGAQSLRNLDGTFDVGPSCCSTSKNDILQWRRSVEDAIRDLPRFSTLLD